MIIEEISKMLPALLTPAGWAIIAGIAVGRLVEKRYVPRMSAFSNGMAINIALLVVTGKHWILEWYGNFCFIMALLGALSYWCEQNNRTSYDWRRQFSDLPKEYYALAKLCGARAAVAMMVALPSWSFMGYTWPSLNSFLFTLLT